jgi:pimeloyl-ACP methyl ester carboxylesterase
VPGAKLHYEVAGSGPTLLFIPGGAADASAFAGVRDVLSRHYTVVTYDPRGISQSPLDGEPPRQGLLREHADDVQRLLAELGGGPAHVFAHSGGAVTAMDYVVRHHAQVRTLILFEPMLLGYLDPRSLVGPDVPTIYREHGLQAAIKRIEEMTGIEMPRPPSNPSPELRAQMKGLFANLDYSLGHLLPAMLEFVPDLGALGDVSTRIIVGVGDKSAEQAAHRSALRLAADLRLTAVSFPGDHAGFSVDPVGFAARLHDALGARG